MLATYVRRMGNKNLEIRIAGSSSRPQIHGRFLSCLSDLVTIKCKLLDRRQKGQRKEGKMGEELLFPSLFPFVFPPSHFPSTHATVRLLIGTWSPHHQTILLPMKSPSRID